MRVGDDELHAAEAAPGKPAQKLDPEWLSFAMPDRHTKHLAFAVGVDANGDDDGNGVSYCLT